MLFWKWSWKSRQERTLRSILQQLIEINIREKKMEEEIAELGAVADRLVTVIDKAVDVIHTLVANQAVDDGPTRARLHEIAVNVGTAVDGLQAAVDAISPPVATDPAPTVQDAPVEPVEAR